MSSRQIADMMGNLVRHQHHFAAMSTEDRQWVSRNTEAAIGLFIEAVQNRTDNAQSDVEPSYLAEWARFYLKHFGLATIDFSGIHLPAKPDYPRRAILVVPQVGNNQAFDACTNAFKTWRYADDLDSVRDVVSRPSGPYVVWVRDTVEADPEMANKSANDIETAGINTLTLKERLLLELKYFVDTGKHLDIRNWTLCAGSRYPGGLVPYFRWDDDGLYVDWANADVRYPDLRARVAVS